MGQPGLCPSDGGLPRMPAGSERLRGRSPCPHPLPFVAGKGFCGQRPRTLLPGLWGQSVGLARVAWL